MKASRTVASVVAALGLAGALASTAAAAYPVPNLVALASADRLVAVTYAANPTPRTQADAGAFASTMVDQFGMVAIPNYDPTTNPDSVLVCDAPINSQELLVVYGIRGAGEDEANAVCEFLDDGGQYVRWR